MTANLITLGRVALVFLVICLFQMNFTASVAAVLLTVVVIYLDSLDGIVARRMGQSSDFGALFDIAGDRIVEHVFWLYFAAIGLISLWVPVICISRSFLVDTLRAAAFSREGKTPFGTKSMMRSPLTRWLTASRFMRGFYGAGKVAAFVALGLIIVFNKAGPVLLTGLPEGFVGTFLGAARVWVWIVVGLCLLRGLPVLWDGRGYLFARHYPKRLSG